jgi:hypothetical protein
MWRMKMDLTDIKLLIGTPCYNGLIHQDYFQGTLQYNQLGFPIAYMHIGNESLITRGRNTIISYFYANDIYTHLLFLDADIYMSGDNLKLLLESNEDVIGAPVPLKGFDPRGKNVYNVGEILNKNGHLIEVEHVGTAVFLLSRNAVESLVKNVIENGDEYSRNPLTRGDAPSDMQYDVFKVGVVDGRYLSEDYYVCKVLRDLGYKVMVDTSIQTRHSGSFTWQGSTT